MNLYPYNLYILLIAFVILIIYLCLTIKKVNPLLSKVNHIVTIGNEAAFKGQNYLLSITNKINAQKELGTKAVKFLNIYLLWRAVSKDYKKADKKGLKQLQSSTTNILQKKQANRFIQESLTHLLG